MDSWESPVFSRSRYIPATGNFTNTYNHQSFSSSLLDAIYKSIDEQGEQDHGVITRKEVDQMAMYKKKLSVDVSTAVRRPAVEERLLRRSADYEASHRRRTATAASSSSDSSSGSGFSSSENESVCYRPVPAEIKAATPVLAKNQPTFVHRREDKASTAKKTKKQPASPGARFAGFLNSLLASAKTAKVVKQAKKVRLSSSSLTAVEELPSPAPSSTSSRSCLSKSGGAAAAGGKRSVRFYPVSVIVDEDSRPCGQKNLLVDPISPSPQPPTTKYLTEELKLHIMEKNRRVEEAADRILNRYQTRTEILLRRESWALPAPEMIEDDVDDSDDESDAASDVSSDLFELKNLSTIGAGAGERYREELPVYETTNFVTNRAIAHGLIM